MIATVYYLDRAACQKLGIRYAYGVHKAVYSLFPRQNDQNRDFLYLDKGGDARGRQILILSKREPQVPAIGKIAVKKVPESFLEHDRYAFEILLNPSQRDSKSRKLIAIRGQEALRTWFLAKCPSWGFAADAPTLEVRRTGVLAYKKNGQTCTHNLAHFVGQLTVTDRPKFKQSFTEGVGRAKSFGFGLLQIIPLTSQTTINSQTTQGAP